MEIINNVFDQQIEKIIDSFPSIYTKDDVVTLIGGLRAQVLAEVSELKPAGGITEKSFYAFSADVEHQLSRALDNGNIQLYDDSSAEFTINYDNRVELENIDINTDNIIDELNSILLDQFREHFSRPLTDDDKPE